MEAPQLEQLEDSSTTGGLSQLHRVIVPHKQTAGRRQSDGRTPPTLKEMTAFSKKPVCGATRKISISSNLVKILWCNHELTLVTHPVVFFFHFFFLFFSRQPSCQMWRKLAGEQKCGEPDESAGSSACA